MLDAGDSGGSPRIIGLEEVAPKKKLPVPIRPIPKDYWTPGRAIDTWERMVSHPWMLPDDAKKEMRELFQATLAGSVYWFELGNGHGYIHVWEVKNGAAKANVEWLGKTRDFIRAYGSAQDCKKIWVKALFKWLKLRRLTVEIAATNAGARKFLTRMGMKQEGVIREGWLVGGKTEDVLIYGILASEVK